jgi:SNF2 family DNA or RNA helicase
MALHPASGGHGLNLQHGGADMCWMSPTWSPEYWEQTIARINRSGQKRQVMVRVCVATNTVDELKLSRVYNKMTAQEAFEAYLRRRQTRNKAA